MPMLSLSPRVVRFMRCPFARWLGEIPDGARHLLCVVGATGADQWGKASRESRAPCRSRVWRATGAIVTSSVTLADTIEQAKTTLRARAVNRTVSCIALLH